MTATVFRVPHFLAALTVLLILSKFSHIYVQTRNTSTLCDEAALGGGLGDRMISLFGSCATARVTDSGRPAVLKVAWRHSWSPARGLAFLQLRPPAPAHFVYFVPKFGSLGRCDMHVQQNSAGSATQNPEYSSMYRKCAQDTQSKPRVAKMICREVLSNTTGVHIRRGDKMLAKVQLEANARHSLMHEQTDEEWRLVALRSLQYCAQLISQGHTRFFVSGDESLVLAGYVRKLEELGGVVVDADAASSCFSRTQRLVYALLTRLRGTNVLDMMRFATCDRILQVAKYSSFSTAAALLGDVPLINFYGPAGSAIVGMKDLARVEFFTPPVDESMLNRSVVGEPLTARDSLGCTADNVFCKHTPEVDMPTQRARVASPTALGAPRS